MAIFACIMKYNTATLSNGLRVIHLPSTSSVVYCGYQIAAGSRNEREEEEGLAHFCEHVTFKGTEHRRAWNVLNCLESVGGDLNAFTNKEDTTYYAAILKRDFPRAVELLTDIVFHSTYPQSEVNKEVEVICEEIESYNDSPSELIYDDFENIIFEGHPLGHNILGSVDNVRRFGSASALVFARKYYRTDNAVFFVYGDIDFKDILKRLNNSHALQSTASVESLSPNSSPLGKENVNTSNDVSDVQPNTIPHLQGGGTLEETATGDARVYIVSKGTHQAHVMVGNRAYDIHDERRMALYLLNNILGGPGMNARLNLVLRERRGLVYTVESSIVSYGDTGLWCTYFGCDPKDVKRCLRLVRGELNRWMNHHISPTRLQAAKKQIKGQIGVACDNRESFALDFGRSFLHYGWEKDIAKLYANIDAISADDILAVARDIFAPERMTTLIYK